MAADETAVLLRRMNELQRLYDKWRREANRQRRRAETWQHRAGELRRAVREYELRDEWRDAKRALRAR